MKITAPFLRDPALIAVLDAIEGGGHCALPVGGCVRNAALGAPVADVDIATDARPDRVIALASEAGLRTVPTGIEHGTVTVLSDGEGFEVTTFRRDVETDGRRAVVAFADRIEDDAQRRDFTMNALYCDRDGVVIDPVGGLDDLTARRLRFVGRAEDRIAEDYLRILRFFRFFAWYGRDADPAALAACTALKDGLKNISRERIGAEMRKLLSAPDPGPAVAMMQESGVLSLILPGADPAALDALLAIEPAPDWPRRLAALGPDAPGAALRLSRDESRVQTALAAALDQGWSLDEAGFYLGATPGADYALVRRARGGGDLPAGWQDRVRHAAASPLPISAADLMPTLAGPELGRGLRAAEAMWIAGGFAVPAPALIDAAILAGQTPHGAATQQEGDPDDRPA